MTVMEKFTELKNIILFGHTDNLIATLEKTIILISHNKIQLVILNCVS